MRKSKCRVKQDPRQTKAELIAALRRIGDMGYGMKEEVRDWANIGRNAVYTAREAVAGKCNGCGKPLEYVPLRTSQVPKEPQ